jgi:hypothetical protein
VGLKTVSYVINVGEEDDTAAWTEAWTCSAAVIEGDDGLAIGTSRRNRGRMCRYDEAVLGGKQWKSSIKNHHPFS